MSAEVEAAEMFVRLAGAGIEETIKIAVPAGKVITKGMVYAVIYAYCKGGKPKDIAANPSGMGFITVSNESIKEVKKNCRKYGISFFSVKNPLDNTSDICIKNTDLANLKRICDKVNIKIFSENTCKVDSSFTKEKEKVKQKKQSIDEALNKRPNRDFTREGAYFFADLEKPTNYISVNPEKTILFRGKERTVSTYDVFNDGKKVCSLNDDPVKNKWINVKNKISETSEIKDGNYVYFKNKEELKNYTDLYKKNQLGERFDLKVGSNERGEKILEGSGVKQLDLAFGKDGVYRKQVPQNTHDLAKKEELNRGLKNTIKKRTEKRKTGLKGYAEEYKKRAYVNDAKKKVIKKTPVKKNPGSKKRASK